MRKARAYGRKTKAENLPDTNVGNIKYIRKQDAVDLVNKISNLDLKAKGGICVSLANLEKADVVPVVHGRWIHMQNIYGVAYCSECSYELHAQNVNFCPNCGAKMDGKE